MHQQGENIMKVETKTKELEPKTLEQRITEVASDASIDTLSRLIAEVEDAISETTASVERERALAIDADPNTEAAHRTWTWPRHGAGG
jgi:hypothetical protein